MCGNADTAASVAALMVKESASLAIHDPPYNFVAFEEQPTEDFIQWCRAWTSLTYAHLTADATLYVWIGADQKDEFRPLPEFMLMMRESGFRSKSFITVRNQRGFGTQKNWMAVRQELLCYTKGRPTFNVEAEYTDIPKILRGYYKTVAGRRTENMERSYSDKIRAGNVWVDVQQVFYRLEENVNGCYAQKPLRAYERIIQASSAPDDLVIDWFAHSGTCLLAAERLGRRCFAMDSDPLYCEIAIRRLERFRTTGRTGWQAGHPFESDAANDGALASALAAGCDRQTEAEDLLTLAEQRE
jgi:site-specific DNA-methyltransferase (adenine-specific)